MTESALQPAVGIPDQALHLIAGYSALAGMMPLLPVPFVDDMIIARVHRRLYQKLSQRYDFYLSVGDAKSLTASDSNLLAGAFFSVVLWPVKKILRKLFYILAVKSCADVAAMVFHEGWLMARALEEEYVPRHDLATGNPETIRRLRRAIDAAHKKVDPKVTQQVMRTAFGVGRHVTGPMLAAIPKLLAKRTDESLDEAEETTAPITKRIEQELRLHWHLAPQLDQALRDALEL